jgi:hypothetical protein
MMIKVNLQEIAPTDGFNEVVPMNGVPRPGDDIEVKGQVYTVRTVIWTPFNPDYEVQVRFR